MTAQVVRLRKFEKPPERLLRDLADDKDKNWEHIFVIATYREKDEEWIDMWYNPGNTTTLTGMLMRAILMLDESIKNDTR